MTRATGAAVLIASLVLAACGGDDDDSTPAVTDHSAMFVGRWDGTSSMTLGGESATAPGAYTRITRLGTNSINVAEFCNDGTGPSAVVTSSTAFRTSSFTRPPVAVEGCSAVTLVINQGGTGNLANGQVTVSVTGSASGCGYTFPFSLTFNGTKTSANPQALMVESATISDAIMSELAARFQGP